MMQKRKVRWKLKINASRSCDMPFLTTICITLMICVGEVLTCSPICDCVGQYYAYCDGRGINSSQLSHVMSVVPTTVTYIDFSQNVIERLTGGTFKKHLSLVNLNLKQNKLQHIDSTTFQPLLQLKKLYLEENHLVEIGAGVFSSLRNLKVLHLQNNKISVIDQGNFLNLTNLQELHIHGNNLRTITSTLFKGLTNLETLDLSQNSIVTIADGAFSSLHKLTKLYLSNNQIKSLNVHAFLGLQSLQELDLRSNQVQQIAKSHLDPVRNSLIRFEFSSNQITTIQSELFIDMTHLRKVNLSHNLISDIQTESFTYLELDELFLQGNKLLSINRQHFKRLLRVKHLDLSWNKISSVSIGSFDNFRESVYVLNLENNMLLYFSNGMVRGMTNLHTLNIATNQLETLENNAFSGLKNLEVVLLQSNKITSLSAGDVGGLTRVSKLDLAFNPLKKFTNFKFNSDISVSMNLTLLSISHNAAHVTWPFENGNQRYWSVSVKCLNASFPLCPGVTEQPEYIPSYTKDKVISGLSPLTEYYICVNPFVISSGVKIQQCLSVTTAELVIPTTVSPPQTRSQSTSDTCPSAMSSVLTMLGSLVLIQITKTITHRNYLSGLF